MFSFTLQHHDSKTLARAGSFETPHGNLLTPALAIVATEGEVRCVPKELFPYLPAQYFIVNTFHLLTKKLINAIETQKGIHGSTDGQEKVFASDSGGFQVFSLGFGVTHGVGKVAQIFPREGEEVKEHAMQGDEENIVNINDDGVTFPYDDQQITLTPERSINLQHNIGADIIFAFDECTSPLNSKEYTAKALDRTEAWLERCISAHASHQEQQALFAIVQGGAYRDLRERAVRAVAQYNVPGFGIGGSLGKDKQDMDNILKWVIPELPEEKPRHLLGIGQVRDLFMGVERGVDLFDCVIPTREARHKALYTNQGKVQVKHRKTSTEPLLNSLTIQGKPPTIHAPIADILSQTTWEELFSLFQAKDPQALLCATIHNICFFTHIMAMMRQAIAEGTLPALKQQILKYY